MSLFTDEPTQAFVKERESVVPEIRKLLDDSDESVRKRAANALKEIDSQTAAKAVVKRKGDQ